MCEKKRAHAVSSGPSPTVSIHGQPPELELELCSQLSRETLQGPGMQNTPTTRPPTTPQLPFVHPSLPPPHISPLA